MVRRPTIEEAAGLLALATVLVAVVLAIEPTLLPAPALEWISAVEERFTLRQVLLAVAGWFALFALWRAYASGAADVTDRLAETSTTADPTDRSTAAAPTGGRLGEATTQEIDRTIAALKRGRGADPDEIRKTLRSALRDVEIARGRSPEAAEARIDAGEWTSDETVAVFLGGPTAGRYSFLQRLLAWLFPGHVFERRLDAALEELERHADRPGGDDGA